MFDRTLIGEGIGTSKSARRVPLHLHTPSPPTLPAPPHSQREEIIKRNATRRAASRSATAWSRSSFFLSEVFWARRREGGRRPRRDPTPADRRTWWRPILRAG